MNEWQPIETAPKDGTPILIYEPPSKYVAEGIYIAEWRTESYITRSSNYKCWVVQFTYNDEMGGEMTIDNPTHWMPLPEPPNTKHFYELRSGSLKGEVVGWTSDKKTANDFEKEWTGNKAVEISEEEFNRKTRE